MRLRSGYKHHLRKSSDQKAQISPVSGTNAFLICAFRSEDFLRWCLSSERNLTHNLFFLFPIVFGINLNHLFDEKKDGASGNSIVCFGALIPCHTIWQCDFYEECELFRRVQRFWQRKVWTQRHSRGEKLRCKFGTRKSAKFFANTKVQIFGKESAKLTANFSATMVTSLPSLSVSLSLSLSLSHRAHRAHNIGSASALPIISTVILQIFGVVLFLIFSVVDGFTEIKKTPKCKKHIAWARQHPQTPNFKLHQMLRDRSPPKFLTHQKFVKFQYLSRII